MKQFMVLVTLGVVILTSILVSGCDLDEKVSPAERMSMFITDVNAGHWNNLKAHTHKHSLMHNLADAAFWQTVFIPQALPLTAPTVTGNTAVSLTKDGLTVTFTLEEETPRVNKIRTIKIADITMFN